MIKHLLKYGIAGIALIAVYLPGQSQVSEDSIDAYVASLPDSARLSVLYSAASAFETSSLSKALKYADQRLTIANKLNNPNHIASTYNLYGNLYLESGLYTNAEKYYRIAYEMYDSLDNMEGLATECHNLGLSYYNRRDTLNSLNFYKESVFVRKITGNSRRIGDGLTTLGEAYLLFKDYDQSIKALYEALEYYSDTTAYPRKFDCLAFITDNLIVLSPEKALQWIRLMEEENALLGRRSYEQMIKLRYASYYLAIGDLQRSKSYLDMINSDSIFLYEAISPVNIYLTLSDKLLDAGDTRNGLNYSITARKIHQIQESHQTADMTSEFKTRLNLRIADEELKAIDEINHLMLQRIRIEEYIKYFVILAVIILSLMWISFMISLLSIRRNAAALNARRNELQEAYNRSLRYKEGILRTRENKNVFFKMISGKLDQPFRELSDELDRLSELTTRAIVRERFIAKLEDILQIGSSIERSLKRVLLWSKLQRNRYEVDKTEINLNDYLHELLPEILALTIRKDIRVRYDIDPAVVINFDRRSLKTILRIFVENSVEYSEPKSDLIIRVQEARTGSVLSVTDSGSGIPGWLKDNIFDIDRDTHNPGTSHKPGIGLLIARQLAEINNATISFESLQTRGTTFYIHITKSNG